MALLSELVPNMSRPGSWHWCDVPSGASVLIPWTRPLLS